jgi:hypothetical protein
LAVTARIDFLDQRTDLLWREVFTEVLQRRGDLGGVDAVKAVPRKFDTSDDETGTVCKIKQSP